MVYTSFSQIVDRAKDLEGHVKMAVAAADMHSIEAVLEAAQQGIVSPILVGDSEDIKRNLAELGAVLPEEDIIDARDLQAAAYKSVELVREGKAQCILKGKLDTAVLLKEVVNRESGIGQGITMSHFTIFDAPAHERLIAAVDGGMVTYPTLQQKKDIIENTVTAMRAMGYEEPKVGVLACVEKINPKMPETIEADELKSMWKRGEIKHCVVEGPISYDCALDKEIADFKGYESPCAGCCDILVAPNIHAANIMGKMFCLTGRAKMAGIIVGAKCPIAMVSRGSSAEEKYISIVLAALVAKGMKTLED